MILRKTNVGLVTVAIFVATFMTAVEGTIVTTAMPTIVGSLHGIELMNWVFSIYLLTSAMLTPIYGKLTDKIGRKPVFMVGTLLFIIGSAVVFAHFLTSERIPHHIAEFLIAQNMSWWVFLIAVNILLFIMGQFMEPSSVVMIMTPLLLPIAVSLGIDPVHFGIIMVVNMEIGMITPPVGLNLFVASSLTGMDLKNVVVSILPWLGVMVFGLALITYIPQISLFLVG